MSIQDLSSAALPGLLAEGSELAAAGPVDTSALAKGPLLFDLSDHDLLAITGRDRTRFLHAMLSNRVDGLAAGQGCWATLNTVEGRTISDARLLVADEDRRDGSVLALLEPGGAPALVDGLDRYIIADKVFFEPRDGETLWLLAGAGTDEALAGVAAELPPAELYSHVMTAIGGRSVRLIRLDRSGDHGDLGLWFDAADADVVTAGLSHVPRGSRAVLEAARIEAGHPRFGIDITPEVIPLEAGLKDRAIDFDKGCYVGQEVICRIDSMGSPKRRLCRLQLQGEAAPEPGTTLWVGNKQVGFVTSAVVSARLGHPVALGFVRRRNNAPGSELSLGSADGPTATVVAYAGD
jgi:tRNA-modifying protein YgfZ